MEIALTQTQTAVEQYLICEENAKEKSEFVNGRVRQMSGASDAHNEVERNLRYAVASRLRAPLGFLFGQKCADYGSDYRVLVEETEDFFYPDVIIVCGKKRIVRRGGDNITNPTALFEILSRSTANYDRTEKFASYRRIPSLREYLLVSQDAVSCEHFVRQDDDTWVLTTYSSPTDTVTLTSVPISLPLFVVYENVFPNTNVTQDANDTD